MDSNFYEIWHLLQIEHANYEYCIGLDDLDPNIWIQANVVPTLKFATIFMKFGTHNKWNVLIINIIHTSF